MLVSEMLEKLKGADPDSEIEGLVGGETVRIQSVSYGEPGELTYLILDG